MKLQTRVVWLQVCLLTGSESWQGAVLLEPGKDSAAQLLRTTRGDHAVVGLEQLPEDDAELSIVKEKFYNP